MIIRQATSHDSKSIAALLLLVMKFMVFRFIGEHNEEKAMDFFLDFVSQRANQYSYQNCYVAIVDQHVVGVITVYDGALLSDLRQPILDFIHQKIPNFVIEDETQAGEIYIDALSVNPIYQGQGIGTQLLTYVIDEFCIKHKKTIGLLVDKKNPKAKKLYLNRGFKKVDEKILSGHIMEHLQFKI